MILFFPARLLWFALCFQFLPILFGDVLICYFFLIVILEVANIASQEQIRGLGSWQMHESRKIQIVYLGQGNPGCMYRLGYKKLVSSSAKSDLSDN